MRRFTFRLVCANEETVSVDVFDNENGPFCYAEEALAELEKLRAENEALRYLSEQQTQIVNKLTASLNRIRGENEALRAKLPRWIPVTERLPHATESCYVLVACRGGLVRETLFVPDSVFFKRRFTHPFSPDAVSDLFECGAEFGYVVTHWMPRPAAPEQEPQV